VPDTDLAAAAGLAVDDGIVVDERLRTSNPDVFAAGDVARFEVPALGKRTRVEHEDNALTMGRAAGRSMAGDETPYAHLPFFYSDLFDLGYEAVGEMDPRGETVSDWKVPFREGRRLLPRGRESPGRAAVEYLEPGRCGAGLDRRARPVPRGRPRRAVAGQNLSAGLSRASRMRVDAIGSTTRPPSAS
jgi:NADPH-dependent 2,4-dienoyl-CoA reductase/sulfur reductase-like enzyme